MSSTFYDLLYVRDYYGILAVGSKLTDGFGISTKQKDNLGFSVVFIDSKDFQR